METPDLSELRAAADQRRRARSRLRKTAVKVAESLIDLLRVGDGAMISSGAEYSIRNVVWRCTCEPGPDGPIGWSPPRAALIRSARGKRVALNDPRYTWFDEEGIPWLPVGRDLFLSPTPWDTGWIPADDDFVSIAADGELVTLAEDAEELVSALAEVVRDDAAVMAGSARTLASIEEAL